MIDRKQQYKDKYPIYIYIYIYIYMKSLIPKGAKSIFYQNGVICLKIMISYMGTKCTISHSKISPGSIKKCRYNIMFHSKRS